MDTRAHSWGPVAGLQWNWRTAPPRSGWSGRGVAGPRVKARKEQNPTLASAKKCRRGGQGAGGGAVPQSPQAGVPGAQEPCRTRPPLGCGPLSLGSITGRTRLHDPGSLTRPARAETRYVAWPGSGAQCTELLGRPAGVLWRAGVPQGGDGAGGAAPAAGFACSTAGSGRAWEAGVVTG